MIIGNNIEEISEARLTIRTEDSALEGNDENSKSYVKVHDPYWRMMSFEDSVDVQVETQSSVDLYPYWMEKGSLLNLLQEELQLEEIEIEIEEDEVEEEIDSRSEILDL